MANIFSGQNMTRIDGKKVRRIREEKGLTQLYLATVVEVTTDTISRWENKRYPSIKQDNAVKLAEALEIELEEILETEEPAAEESRDEETQIDPAAADFVAASPSAYYSQRPLIGLIILTLIIFIGGGAWWFYSRPEPVTITAIRFMPAHTPAGEIFPVIVKVSTDRPESFSLLLKETIPSGFTIEKSSPPHTIQNNSPILKWVSRTTGTGTSFVYLLRPPENALPGSSYELEGVVTLGKEKKTSHRVEGNTNVEIAGFHWADMNRDNIISDAEILTAYDNFNSLDELGFNWDRLDTIWAGRGYRWNPDSRKHDIIH